MIQVNDLCYSYPKQNRSTLQNMHFQVERGEIFGFLGPSGAGKSTTQNILIGKLRNYKGSVRVFDQETKSMDADYYERIGVAFEFPNFYPRFTALENLQHFQSLYRNRRSDPLALLKDVGLGDAAHVKVEQFSKGMKMRLNFCRAVLGNPDLLFLDEPTSGLDPVHADNLKQLILERKKAGTTILLTTHHMRAAEQLCDRVAFIVDGQIKVIDSPRELMVRHGQRRLCVEYEQHGERRSADFPLDGIGEHEPFLQLIRTCRVITMHSQEATLDDIFIEITGRRLQ